MDKGASQHVDPVDEGVGGAAAAVAAAAAGEVPGGGASAPGGAAAAAAAAVVGDAPAGGGDGTAAAGGWACVATGQEPEEERFSTEQELEAHIVEKSGTKPGAPLSFIARKSSAFGPGEAGRQERGRAVRAVSESSQSMGAGELDALLSTTSSLRGAGGKAGAGADAMPPPPSPKGPRCRLFPDVPPTTGEKNEAWLKALEGLLGGEDVDTLLSRDEMEGVLDVLARVARVEPACVAVTGGPQRPITVVGDLHGQRRDLLHGALGPFLRGERRCAQLVFLGDYVDRGADGLGVLATVSLLKLLFPDRVYLLRGNHEDPGTNCMYGFMQECQRRYPDPDGVDATKMNGVWLHANAAFAALPVAATLCVPPASSGGRPRRAFCCHGGLSPSLVPQHDDDPAPPATPDGAMPPPPSEGGGGGASHGSLPPPPSDVSGPGSALDAAPNAAAIISACDRESYGGLGVWESGVGEVASEGPPPATKAVIDGLLWSDPSDPAGASGYNPGFVSNCRGCGWRWGEEASQQFCDLNGFDWICRSHQLVAKGIQWQHTNRVVTIFSASNYCGVQGNRGAVLHLTEGFDIELTTYSPEDVASAGAASAPDAAAVPAYFR